MCIYKCNQCSFLSSDEECEKCDCKNSFPVPWTSCRMCNKEFFESEIYKRKQKGKTVESVQQIEFNKLLDMIKNITGTYKYDLGITFSLPNDVYEKDGTYFILSLQSHGLQYNNWIKIAFLYEWASTNIRDSFFYRALDSYIKNFYSVQEWQTLFAQFPDNRENFYDRKAMNHMKYAVTKD